jgi:MSHA biogenesis protein MshN
MSVVNKMLSDLENRPHQVQSNANYVPPKSNKFLWLSIGVLSVCCIVAVLSNFVEIDHSSSRPATTTEQMLYDPDKGDKIAQVEQGAQNKSTFEAEQQNVKQQAIMVSNNPAPEVNKTPAPVSFFSKSGSAQGNTQETNTLSNGAQNTQLDIKPSDGSKGRLSQLRAQAHHASEKGDEQAVVASLQKIIELAPEDLRTRKQLAAMLFSKQKFQAAQQVLLEALVQAPADSSSRLMLARIHYRAGKNTAALDTLKAHPHHTLASDELLSFRAALAESIGEYQLAQGDYQLLVNRNPNEAKWWLGLGVSLDKQKLGEEAIASYEQAKSLKQLPQQVDTFVEQRIRLLARRS